MKLTLRCVRNFLTVETVSDYETVSPIILYQSTETTHVSFMLYMILIASYIDVSNRNLCIAM